eukprot:scaffold53827_cov46-Prasinocladus_malaysianus.AAC.4
MLWESNREIQRDPVLQAAQSQLKSGSHLNSNPAKVNALRRLFGLLNHSRRTQRQQEGPHLQAVLQPAAFCAKVLQLPVDAVDLSLRLAANTGGRKLLEPVKRLLHPLRHPAVQLVHSHIALRDANLQLCQGGAERRNPGVSLCELPFRLAEGALEAMDVRHSVL